MEIKFSIQDKTVEKDKSLFRRTSRRFLMFGVPQGFNPPEKLGKLRHTIDRML